MSAALWRAAQAMLHLPGRGPVINAKNAAFESTDVLLISCQYQDICSGFVKILPRDGLQLEANVQLFGKAFRVSPCYVNY
jgi:hypothetical protein